MNADEYDVTAWHRRYQRRRIEALYEVVKEHEHEASPDDVWLIRCRLAEARNSSSMNEGREAERLLELAFSELVRAIKGPYP